MTDSTPPTDETADDTAGETVDQQGRRARRLVRGHGARPRPPGRPGRRPRARRPARASGCRRCSARAGVGSRRVCEDMIDEGRISVERQQVVLVQGMRVDPATDQIAVDGVRIEIRDDRVTYAMNKPFGVLTAMSDDRGRPDRRRHGRRPGQGPGARRPAGPGHRGPADPHHRRRAGPPAGAPLLRGAQDLPGAGVGLGAARPGPPAAGRHRARGRPGRGRLLPSSSTPTPASPSSRWCCTRAASTSSAGCWPRSACRSPG